MPSHNYVYSFEPKADFSSVYGSSAEIQKYLDDFVWKHGLSQYLRLSHSVEETTWNEKQGQWEVCIRDLTTGRIIRDHCHILVHATGYLNNPAWPKIPGMKDFMGQILHSAQYDPGVSLANKDVLLIGAGSTAVQILPAIQPIAKSVTIFIRSPTWVLPDISTEAGQFTSEQIKTFLKNPQTVMELRQKNERTMNSIFSLYLKSSVLQEQCKTFLESEMRKLIPTELAQTKLIPNFSVGCKRVIPSGFNYLKVRLSIFLHLAFRCCYRGLNCFAYLGFISDSCL